MALTGSVPAGTEPVYGYQLAQGLELVLHPGGTGIVKVLVGIIVAVYGLGLARAWELLGAQRFNLLAGLNAMSEQDQLETVGNLDHTIFDSDPRHPANLSATNLDSLKYMGANPARQHQRPRQ